MPFVILHHASIDCPIRPRLLVRVMQALPDNRTLSMQHSLLEEPLANGALFLRVCIIFYSVFTEAMLLVVLETSSVDVTVLEYVLALMIKLQKRVKTYLFLEFYRIQIPQRRKIHRSKFRIRAHASCCLSIPLHILPRQTSSCARDSDLKDTQVSLRLHGLS